MSGDAGATRGAGTLTPPATPLTPVRPGAARPIAGRHSLWRLAWRLAVAVVLALLLWRSFVIVEPGERGLVSIMGRLQPLVLTEGPHFVWPWEEVRRENVQFNPITQEVHGLAKDRLPLQVRLTVAYHVPPRELPAVARDVGLSQVDAKVVLPALQNVPETVFAERDAAFFLDQRPAGVAALREAVTERLAKRGVQLDQFDATFIFPTATVEAVRENERLKQAQAEEEVAASKAVKPATAPPAKPAAPAAGKAEAAKSAK